MSMGISVINCSITTITTTNNTNTNTTTTTPQRRHHNDDTTTTTTTTNNNNNNNNNNQQQQQGYPRGTGAAAAGVPGDIMGEEPSPPSSTSEQEACLRRPFAVGSAGAPHTPLPLPTDPRPGMTPAVIDMLGASVPINHRSEVNSPTVDCSGALVSLVATVAGLSSIHANSSLVSVDFNFLRYLLCFTFRHCSALSSLCMQGMKLLDHGSYPTMSILHCWLPSSTGKCRKNAI